MDNLHRQRFAAAYVGLAAIVAGAVGLTVLMAVKGGREPWTSHPIKKISDPVERAETVAALVQGRYVKADASPLFTVSAGEDVITDLPGRDQFVALGSSANGAPWSFEQGSIAFFKLCGPGAGCAFSEPAGEARTKAFAVATREAKELALRGLKNVPEAKSAIVVLPVGVIEATPTPTLVAYWRRKDLESELDRTLDPLFEAPVPDPASLTAEQAQAEIAKSADHLFLMNAKPAPDNALMIYELTPLPPA